MLTENGSSSFSTIDVPEDSIIWSFKVNLSLIACTAKRILNSCSIVFFTSVCPRVFSFLKIGWLAVTSSHVVAAESLEHGVRTPRRKLLLDESQQLHETSA